METIKLSNGVLMPKLGYGVFQISKEDCKRCVLDAIESGYRHIDTAAAYQNESEVGEAIAETEVERSELFITTKVWIDRYSYEQTIASVLESIEKLQVEYIDLVLLHQSIGDYYDAYRGLTKLYNDGKIRAIGVSNFYPDRITDLAIFSEVVPHVNQIEINPFHQQIFAKENMEKLGVVVQAWAPFGEGRSDMFANPLLTEIGNKYNKSVAQVILRWLYQRDIVSLAKTVSSDRMKQNIDIFDFELTNEDMEAIKTLDSETSLFFNHQTPEIVEQFGKPAAERLKELKG